LLVLLCAVFLLVAPAVQAQQAAPPQSGYKPEIGQAGKDVVWVPSAPALVEKMLDLAKVTAQDYVIDLGSGDGPIVIGAARRGAKALGIEYNPDMVELARRNAEAAGVSAKATFMKADIFESDFSQATVITMFLLPQLNLKLRPKLLDLKPGTRIVSNTFTMDDWLPDDTVRAGDACETWCLALLWIIPAKVQGTWTLPQGELTLAQQFQVVTGTLTGPRGALSVENGKMNGAEISFTVDGARYRGKAAGDTMTGTRETVDGKSEAWTAKRVK
jgi:SAM-dependent methyltransferase